MTIYAAFLGHQPKISLAELAAVVPGLELKQLIDKQIAVFSSNEELPMDVIDTLGGTVCLAQEVRGGAELDEVPQILKNEVSKVRGKVTFGLRTVGIPRQEIRQLYRKCKEKVKSDGRSVRYVGNERKPAASVLLHDEEMLTGKHGCELTILRSGDSFWVGRTVGAQNVDSYTHRDMEKPVRDTRAGFLPPKLAQILLNFGWWLCKPEEVEPGKRKKTVVLTIFDPFCGSGVIPMEALLRGWHVLASDIALKAVNGCEKNLEWLRKEEKILKKDISSTVWKQDARKPFVLKELPTVIVTETHLGPPLEGRAAQKEAQKLRSEIDKMQIDFLKNVAESLPGVPIVCTWPVWVTKTQTIALEQVWKALESLPYTAVLPIQESQSHGRPTLLYRRPDQFVGREIVLLKPR